MKDIFKAVGAILVLLLFVAGASLLFGLFVMGGVWLSLKIVPWLERITGIAFAVTVLVLLPLACFRKTRAAAAIGLLICSFVFGAALWVWGFLITYALWGGVGLAIGLVIAGVGVVPIAMLATLFKGAWSVLGGLVVMTVITFGTRFLAFHLAEKADKESFEDLNLSSP